MKHSSIYTVIIILAPACRILTWNVRGIMSSSGSLSKLFDIYEIDFAFISEHKLRIEHEVFLDSVHSNYHSITLCDSSIAPGTRCGKGGVTIMYKKNCQFSVTPLDIQVNDRILGMKIDQHDAMPIYAFSMYMPSVNYSTDEYQECFACLQNLNETFCAHGIVLFLGDFNCDIYKAKAGDDRLRNFVSFLETTYMTAVPLEGYCTFRPTCKTLDYVLLNKHQHDLIISNAAVDKDICMVSDHLPIFTLLKSEVVTYSIPQCVMYAFHQLFRMF